MNNPNTKEWWNEYYSKPTKFSAKTMYVLYHLIPHKVSVLDIGCGTGELIKRLVTNKKCPIKGIDISSVMVDTLNKCGLPAERWNVENFDEFKEKYDVVVLSHTLEHITHDEGLIKNCRRIARKFILVAVPEEDSPSANIPEHVQIYSQQRLSKLLGKYFSQVEDYSIKPHLILKAYV